MKAHNLFEFIAQIPFNLNGKIIVCHSDLTIFGRDLAQLKNKFINDFMYASGIKALYIPTFNLDTDSKEFVNLDEPPRAMGALASEAVKLFNEGQAFRTPNPIHSYVSIGKDTILMPDCNHCLSFGDNSIFDYFIENNFIWLSLGAGSNSGFTIFHHLETLASAPYRKWIEFERTYIYGGHQNHVNYKYYGRDDFRLEQDFEPAVNYLVENKCLIQFSINGKNSFIGSSNEIANLILTKLIDNPLFLVKNTSLS